MTHPVAVWKVGLSDLASLGPVDDPDIFDDVLDPARVARFVAEPGHGLFAAAADGRLVGQLCAMVQRQLSGPDALYVDNLGVSVRYRRRGIARQLWGAACEWGRSEGCGAVWVPTQAACGEAIALYKALGLVEGSAITFEAAL